MATVRTETINHVRSRVGSATVTESHTLSPATSTPISDGELAQLRALAAVGENMTTIVHEIRSPLGAIAGFAELLARKAKDHPELHETAEKIQIGTLQLTVLIQKLLDLSRNTPLQIRPVDWRQFLSTALDQFESEASRRGARITFVRKWGEAASTVEADPLCLRQAVWNVLENAEHAVNEIGEIEIICENPADGVLNLRIADRGTGIDPSLLPRLFTPFVTTRGAGTGLGLAAARKIVEAHGGQIAIQNRDGGGAEVVINLPAKVSE